jgi:DNA-binding MltR family transcriptional regulator
VRHKPKPPGLPNAPRGAQKKKPKPTIRELIGRVPSEGEETALQQAVFSSPPMVTAILGQAMIEIELDKLLQRFFKKSDGEIWDRLSAENAPLDTFHRKIIMGWALGLYSDHTMDHLNKIRLVRNAFAHSKIVIDFDDPTILHELRSAKLPDKQHSQLFKEIKRVRSSRTAGRWAYRQLCTSVFIVLVRRMIRGTVASTKNLQRKANKAYRDNPLSASFLSSKDEKANVLASLLLNYTAGPNTLAHGARGLLGLGVGAMRDDSEDK